MVPLIHKVALALSDVATAIAETGVQAHAGIVVLAKNTSIVQQARSMPKRLRRTDE